MKRFKGQKIQEGSDLWEYLSLTLTADELSTIPDPLSFEDFAINTKEALQAIHYQSENIITVIIYLKWKVI